MSKKNAIEISKHINDEYKNYLISTFKLGSEKLQNKLENQIDKEELFNGPYLNLNLPFKRGLNLNQLIDEGVISNLFKRLNGIDLNRPLYFHQEEAIRHICSGNSAIITTGTGSGKTECFLYPVLNELMREIENGKREKGIRALFLYPMNALVNDQIDRLREILLNFPEITYGFYTGNTPERVEKNKRKRLLDEQKILIPENELISREEIRDNPPDLLFTNYSMLEYLLIRPNDYSIISEDMLKNWKYVVLDEAHTYSGSLGIEISLLLRRVTGLTEVKPRFILTSATLGEKGKSEKDIVKFAKNLTSVEDFNENDIIFSKHIYLDQANIEYATDPEDYVYIKNNLEKSEVLLDVFNKYGLEEQNNIRIQLYELLSKDKNVYDLYRALKPKSKKVIELYQALECEMSIDQLIAMIDLINMAEKDGIGLFDLKYHSFIRPISGAYITLGKEQNLSLKKSNYIDGLKAFEVGNCRYCNTIYIVGRVVENPEDNLMYLQQNGEIDIYENYGSNKSKKVDYFLLEEKKDDEVEDTNLEEHILCAKCGAIRPKDNLNGKDCECDDSFKRSVYKVLYNGKSVMDDLADGRMYNNIPVCVCCGSKAKTGVVRLLNLGKDSGTAIVSQILYEAIDEGNEVKIKPATLSLKLRNKTDERVIEKKVKQILTFSDSRQQASGYVIFMSDTNDSIIRRRLIWSVIEESNYKDIGVDVLVSNLANKIKSDNLIDNNLNSEKNAWLTVLIDLLQRDGRYNGEGLCLYHFDLDLDIIDSQLNEEDVTENFGKYNINKADLLTIIQVIAQVFKVSSAVNYVKSGLTLEDKSKYLAFRRFDNYVCLKSAKGKSNCKSLLPIKGESNKYLGYIQKVFMCENDEAKDILGMIFDLLVEASSLSDEPLLIKNTEDVSYKTNVSKYILKNYKTTKYYQCEKCKNVTPYNVHDKCVIDGCSGRLVEIDPDEVLKDNYYRKKYKTKKIEPLVIKEHTAQLNMEKAKQYQNDFKNKKINILSCSTTFEMGVDIGSLENVFMRNVPPTPANYVQRAGRAGRRKDSSAYILTYCGVNSHDYTYFLEPEKMISGIIQPPYFKVLNEKIITRHLMAVSLGFFFRENKKYYGNVDNFVFNGGFERFNNYMLSSPSNLIEYIDNKVLPEEEYRDFWNLQWLGSGTGYDEKLNQLVESINRLEFEYDSEKKKAIEMKNYQLADYYSSRIKLLHAKRILNSLSEYCVIPKYGFPIDVVELNIFEDGKRNQEYKVERDLRIGISEFAPDCEVIIDNKKYVSRYIVLPTNKTFEKYYYVRCKHCGRMNIFNTENFLICKNCGLDISDEDKNFYIDPNRGFIANQQKVYDVIKPEKSYMGEITYIGEGYKDNKVLRFGCQMSIETSSADRLLVMNRNTFFMCPLCGYSIKAVNYDKKKVEHTNSRERTCHGKLERINLGHMFQTDVARFEISALNMNQEDSYERAISFLYAFLEGISATLDIERTDIDGIVEMNEKTGGYDVLIYDNVPGGAGHTKRLLNGEDIIRSLKYAKSKISQNCCDIETSCYNCLRNYYNQKYHSKLRRSYAIEIIDAILSGIEKIDPEYIDI